ncbi:aldehyde-activating protein [Labrenzia sp. C1B10]|nr:aldehyde-activating protein [Labrenzia sp. C1B10]ERS07170.1 aldehyde-activating protein [Labrenzia sp. C1B70]MBN8180630.1 GFA family protein [Roseibium aggregatum]MBO6856801.1 GFA family protein [Roseibium sp.]
MCQKAFGGFYAPLVSVPETSRLVWTRGSLKHFQSSNHATRGFCADCGTPLTYEAPDGIALAIGTFDDPSQIPPSIQFGVEAKLPYADSMAQIPERVTEDDMEAAPFLASLVSFQHPDHDTETWPPVRTGANDNE